MRKDEIIKALEIIATTSEPIQVELPDAIFGYGVLIKEVGLDSFLFVINSALSILREGGNS